jgi:hypothetical protein
MANLPISQLPEILGTGLTTNAEFAVAQSGTTYKVKRGNLYPYPVVYGLFSQTGNSATISGTTSESSIVGTGIGSLSVPANGFSVGDSFNCTMIGHLSSKNNDTLTIKVKSGSVILGQMGAITMPQCTNQHYHLQIYFTIRTIGGAGTSSIMSGGNFTYSKDASNTFEGEDFSELNNSTFDTTINNSLDITAQWSSSDVANSIYSEIFILNKVY